MLFKEVIGQEEVKKHLIKQATEERVPHAQLFLEKAGSGGLALALAFSQYLNCEQRTEIDSCGVCTSCAKASKLIHPDIHYTYPTISLKPGKPPISIDFIKEWREAIIEQPYLDKYDWLQAINAENKQGNITAFECRRVIGQLQLKSYEGKYKILIIWSAEDLGKEGNILLKLIEEPPPHTVIILVASNYEQLLTTITSRTQTLLINRIDDESLTKRLQEASSLNDEQLLKVVNMAEGNYRKVQQLLTSADSEMSEHLNTWLVASMNNQSAQLVEWIQEVSGSGREFLKQFLNYLLFFFRECLIMNTSEKPSLKLSLKEKGLAQRLSKL